MFLELNAVALECTNPTYDHIVDRKKIHQFTYSKKSSHLVSIKLGLRLGSCHYQFTFLIDLRDKCTISLLFSPPFSLNFLVRKFRH